MASTVARSRSLFDAAIIEQAVVDSFRKLAFRRQVRNPVMFVVYIGSILTSLLWLQALVGTGVRRDPLAELTPRELRTLGLLAEGKSYGRIADELNVSYKTVVNTCSQLKDKLRVRSLPDYDVTPEWVLNHLVQHEAEHRAEIAITRAVFEGRRTH